MKRLLLIVCLGLVGTAVLPAQSPDDLNEGSKVEWDEANAIWRLKWWGKAGRTYFIQHSADLTQPWQWVPSVTAGGDTVKEWGFNTTADRFFVRLRHSDIATGDPAGADFDADGIGNLAEVEQGLDPLRTDSDFDGLSDLLELASGANPAASSQPVGSVGLFVYLGGEQ
jgi:hypothetical protein